MRVRTYIDGYIHKHTITPGRYAAGEPLLWTEEQEEDAQEKSSESSESKARRTEQDAEGYVWVRAVVWTVENKGRSLQVCCHV
jgi:hypothetical protein